jgi:branched-chain amino acid transport system ATP-binding protein
MTVAENVAVALMACDGDIAGLAPALPHHAAAADRLLRQVGLADAGARLCATIAYGDLKRVELAMALAAAPRVLLMDEPTAGMAAGERGQLMRLVSGLAGERGMAVLFTEHDMDVVFGHAERVLVMNRGRIIANGAPEAIRRDPLVREVYLGDL